VLVIFEHDGYRSKFKEIVFAKSGLFLVVGVAGEVFTLEGDAEEDVLGASHEAHFQLLPAADDVEEFDVLEVFGSDVFEDRP
jgi:hypothetical protein